MEEGEYKTITISSPFSYLFKYPDTPPVHIRLAKQVEQVIEDNHMIESQYLLCLNKVTKLVDVAESDSQCS